MTAHISPAHISPAHISPAHVSPAHVSPAHVSPAHVSPAHVSPAHVSPAHVSPASVSIAVARASSGWPVWGVIAALAAGIFVVVLVILAVAGRHPRNMIVRQHRPRLWVGRDERIKRAAAADVEALAGRVKLVKRRRGSAGGEREAG